MKLDAHERVVGAWAESYPEYGTRLVCVCIRDGRDGSHRVEAIQAEEQSPQMRNIHPIATAATRELMGWVLAMTKVRP